MASVRVKQQAFSRNLSGLKENIYPAGDSDMSIKAISKYKDPEDGLVNRNLTPLRQTLLDFSPRRSSAVDGFTTTPETTVPELSDKIARNNKVNQVIANEVAKTIPTSPATRQTTLESTVSSSGHQSKLKKHTKQNRQKLENTLTTIPRHRSVEQRATLCDLPRSVRTKAISVSPKKSVVKRDGTDASTNTSGKKLQTQLTTYGIRRTARQFAKDMQVNVRCFDLVERLLTDLLMEAALMREQNKKTDYQYYYRFI